MKNLFCIAAALLTAPCALADEFCDDLKAAIAAGEERPVPFDSQADPDKKLRADGSLASFGPSKLIRGLPDGARCRRYIAGLPEKVVGGGTYNSISCSLPEAGDDIAAMDATRDAVAARITACLGPAGWKAGKLDSTGTGRLAIKSLKFTPPSGSGDVVIEAQGATRITRDGKTSTSWTQELQIRQPTLWPEKPAQ
jgi:hypothetical protein